eukprot:CAMPEP_0196744052 /NCGR_PEP_ID=MMETSP1091-20130531/55739_1 /TAXON_ID=302021 /ORGANISM="Rhodomonas sp., Strain CCMP768" /LENGTH=52 /DNA_ID=CAMNT_0042090527 /DNA_START=212 /DNA_END=367 /DNA_ORIENTATION=-
MRLVGNTGTGWSVSAQLGSLASNKSASRDLTCERWQKMHLSPGAFPHRRALF